MSARKSLRVSKRFEGQESEDHTKLLDSICRFEASDSERKKSAVKARAEAEGKTNIYHQSAQPSSQGDSTGQQHARKIFLLAHNVNGFIRVFV